MRGALVVAVAGMAVKLGLNLNLIFDPIWTLRSQRERQKVDPE